MSRIDISDLIICEEKSSSDDYLISDSQSVRVETNNGRKTYVPPFPSTDLFKTFVPTPSTDIHSTLLLETAILYQTESVFCDIEERESLDTWEDRKTIFLQKEQAKWFDCDCSQDSLISCPFCLNSKQLQTNSSILKFFQYVIAFKTENAPSYYNTNISKQHTQMPNKYPKNARNSLKNSRQLNSRIVQRASLRSKKCANSEFGKELTNIIALHQNYYCDLCQRTPIVGSRYHCPECDDYDQCQECHTSSEHRHLMEQVDRSGKQRQLQSMVQILAQPLGKKTLKPPSCIQNMADSYLPNFDFK